MIVGEFMPLDELSAASTYAPNSLRNQHASGRGPLAPILTRFGGKLGCWRCDWDALVASQRRLKGTEKQRLTA
jgi:hypothetical protein